MEKSETYSEEGDEALDILAKQEKFTEWMYEEISPWISGHILEVGSGTGTYSKYIMKDDKKAVFSDVDDEYVKKLKKKFPKNDAFLLDISDAKQTARVRKKHKFDTIIFLNVLEHVKKDREALRLLYTLLNPGGRIICLVPTHKWLYNTIDEALDHFRRYTKKELRQKVEEANYIVEKLFAFNVFAIPGWFINGNIFKKNVVDAGAVKLFNSLVPVFRFIEHYILFRKVGISTIIVGRK